MPLSVRILPLAELPEAAIDAIGDGDAVGAIALPIGTEASAEHIAELGRHGLVIVGHLVDSAGEAWWGVDYSDAARQMLAPGREDDSDLYGAPKAGDRFEPTGKTMTSSLFRSVYVMRQRRRQ
jgi:hypothetical protein